MFRPRSSSKVQDTKRPEEKKIEADDPSLAEMVKGSSAVVVSAGLDRVPPPFLHGVSLKEIVLDYNRLKVVPLELFQLPNLKKLSLQHNYISVIPDRCSQVSSKKLSTVALEGNPLAFPPPAIAAKGWSTVKKWVAENPSFIVYRLYHSEKDGRVSYIDFQYSAIRDPMVKAKDEDRDASYVLVDGEAEATRLPTGNRPEWDKDKVKGANFSYSPNQAGVHLKVVSYAYFAVFDGHSGAWVSNALTNNLHKKMFEAGVFTSKDKMDYEAVLRKVWMDLDTTICQKLREHNYNDGSTAVTVTFRPSASGEGVDMICAHVGDSRAMCRRGKDFVDLTTDQVPDRKSERERVEGRGGKVEFHKGCWRINNNLSVTRAFGDTNLKEGDKPIVDAEPEVSVAPVTSDLEFLVVSSDGLTHLLDTKDIGKSCSKLTPEESVMQLFADITGNTRSSLLGHDNTTIIGVRLSHGSVPVEEKVKGTL